MFFKLKPEIVAVAILVFFKKGLQTFIKKQINIEQKKTSFTELL